MILHANQIQPLELVFSPMMWLKIQFLIMRANFKVLAIGIASKEEPLYIEDMLLLAQYNRPERVKFKERDWEDYKNVTIKTGHSLDHCARIFILTHPKSNEPDAVDLAEFRRLTADAPFAILCTIGKDLVVHVHFEVKLAGAKFSTTLESKIATEVIIDPRSAIGSMDWEGEFIDCTQQQFTDIVDKNPTLSSPISLAVKPSQEQYVSPDVETIEIYLATYSEFFAQSTADRTAELELVEGTKELPRDEIAVLKYISDQITAGKLVQPESNKTENKQTSVFWMPEKVEEIAITEDTYRSMNDEARMNYMLTLGTYISCVEDDELKYDLIALRDRLRTSIVSKGIHSEAPDGIIDTTVIDVPILDDGDMALAVLKLDDDDVLVLGNNPSDEAEDIPMLEDEVEAPKANTAITLKGIR